MQRQRSKTFISAAGLILGVFLTGGPAQAYDNQVTPQAASEKIRDSERMSIQEQLGGKLDLSLMVTNEKGESKPLSSYFASGRPVLLSLIYFNCPGLCNFHLNGVFEGLKKVDWSPGKDFEILALSFDAKENSELAAGKKANYMTLYDRPSAASGIHFLTADEQVIAALTKSVGFNFRWDEPTKQWAHSSAAIFVSPEGTITRYLHGIMYEARDLKLALTEAANGKIGSFVDQMIWYCFMYDPSLSKYTIYAFRLVQIGGVFVILFLAALIVPQILRARQQGRLQT